MAEGARSCTAIACSPTCQGGYPSHKRVPSPRTRAGRAYLCTCRAVLRGAGAAKEQVEAALARRDEYSLIVVDDNLYYRR